MNDTSSPSVPPNHRDLYVIIAGILLGVILGPGVLGRISPGHYERWFVAPVVEAVDPGDITQQLAAIIATGATQQAVEEKTREIKEELQRRNSAAVEQAAAADHIQGRAPAMIFAVLVMMVLESLLPAGSALRGRLVMVRYGLIALWLALLMAQPAQIKSLPIAFTAMLVVVSLIAVFLPLPRRA